MTVAEPPVSELHANAREALAEHRWADTIELFGRLDVANALEPDELEGLGQAYWWRGELSHAIQTRGRAYAAHLAAGDRRRAAGVALKLATDYGHRLDSSMAAGWVRRAEGLLDGLPDAPEHVWLGRAHLDTALRRGDLDAAMAEAEHAVALAASMRDRNLEALAMHDMGRVLLARGAVSEGRALLDDAMVAAIGGDLDPYETAIIYCNATVACQDMADYRRAAEFADAARRWCDRQSIGGFPGMCRVRRVEIARLRGAWAEAEEEAHRACAELADFSLEFAGEGFYQIGEIRLRVGDLARAETAFRQAHEFGRDPLPGLALLRHAQGRTSDGAALLRRALADLSLPALARARLLPADIELSIGLSDLERAERDVEELGDIAGRYETHALRAAAAVGTGVLLLARGAGEEAVASLQLARRLWQDTDAPYDMARARVTLADAYRLTGDNAAAALELESAVSTFERLGAGPDAATATAALQRAAQTDSPASTRRRALLFTDIVRSTDLVEAIGDVAWTRLLGWHDRTIRGLVAAHDGEEINHSGDGFLIAFLHAAAALDCAVAIQRTLATHRADHGFAPHVRVGVHVGDTLHTGAGYVGRTIHAAARIMALAGTDEIIASEAVVAESGRAYRHSPPREVSLRGIRGTLRVVSVESR